MYNMLIVYVRRFVLLLLLYSYIQVAYSVNIIQFMCHIYNIICMCLWPMVHLYSLHCI